MFDVKNLHHAYLVEGDQVDTLSEINSFLEKDLGVVLKGNPDYWQAEFENFSIDDARALKERAGMKASGKKFFIVSFNSSNGFIASRRSKPFCVSCINSFKKCVSFRLAEHVSYVS